MREVILNCVVSSVRTALDDVNVKVSEAMTFDELGLDSLDVAELAMDLEDLLDIEIQEDDFTEIKTIGEAVNFINKKVET